MTIYAVGDVHGQLEKLRAAYGRILADKQTHGTQAAQVVFIGDYTDRGPDSKGVIDWMIQQRAAGVPLVCLEGNHDRMMRAFVDPDYTPDPRTAQFDWLIDKLGGRETLKSYGVSTSFLKTRAWQSEKLRAEMPPSHLEFLRSLKTFHRHGDLLFVHAGLRPGIRFEDQNDVDPVWIRQEFLEDTSDHGALIVHGHTPARRVEYHCNRVNIDTGAGFDRTLSAVVFERGKIFELVGDERVPVSRLPSNSVPGG